MGYTFEVMAADIDEKTIRNPDPNKLVLLLAHAKADALLPKIKENAILITSDLVAIWNGQIREKPENLNQAREYLETLHEYPSQTVMAVVVINTKTQKRLYGEESAKVYFKPIPKEIIEKYLAKSETNEKAGGYTIDEPLLIPYIDRIEGTTESVLGLPTQLTQRLITEAQAE